MRLEENLLVLAEIETGERNAMTPASTDARRRGPRKVRLDTDKIVAAGLEVASEVPSGSFSAKLLGQRLGVDPSAVYRHFPSKSHLMAALLDELHLITLRRVTAPKSAWRERIVQLAEATLLEYCRYPSIAAEAMRLTTHGPGELSVIELLLDAYLDCGLDDEGAVRYYALTAAHILSTASSIALTRTDQGEPDAKATDESAPWFDGPILVDPRTHPQIARLSMQLARLDDREIFLSGLGALLDAAEREAADSAR